AGAPDSANAGKDCCLPGTDTPVSVSVCGQCGAVSKRDAADAVYCSCRCCAPCCPAGTSTDQANAMGCSNDPGTCGAACDPSFDYCTCPTGFSCTDVIPNALPGFDGGQTAGAYCVKQGTAYHVTVPCDVDVAGFSGSVSCAQ